MSVGMMMPVYISLQDSGHWCRWMLCRNGCFARWTSCHQIASSRGCPCTQALRGALVASIWRRLWAVQTSVLQVVLVMQYAGAVSVALHPLLGVRSGTYLKGMLPRSQGPGALLVESLPCCVSTVAGEFGGVA